MKHKNGSLLRSLEDKLNKSLRVQTLDSSDIQYAVKEICREMSRPTVGGRRKIKHVARYLAGAERMVWTFGDFDEEVMWIDVMVDSDWAGDLPTRRSTCGGSVVAGLRKS